MRRARWLAAAVRQAYDLDWVPPSVVANLVAIRVDPQHRAVILVLRSGTRIEDRHTRIDVIGPANDVTMDELVAAVQRRGWDAVELHGNAAFRREAAFRLQLLDPPVAIANSPLTEADQVRIEELRRARAVHTDKQPGPDERGMVPAPNW